MNIPEKDKEKLVLDQESLKAVTVNTRVQILKILQQKQEILSDIASLLGMSIPTIKEHLEVLEKVGMVNKIEEGRKWKYYDLTEKGKCLLNPDRKRLWLTLSVLIIGVFGTIFLQLQSTLNLPDRAASMKLSFLLIVFIIISLISLVTTIILLIRIFLRSRPND